MKHAGKDTLMALETLLGKLQPGSFTRLQVNTLTQQQQLLTGVIAHLGKR